MAAQTADYQVWVDGAARGNPGKAGAGVYVKQGAVEIIRKGFFLGHQTNNSAEYLALALGIFLIKQEIGDGTAGKITVAIHSDSQLLVRQMQGTYQIRMPHIQKLKAITDHLAQRLHCTFEHVVREKNSIADALANRGIDEKVLAPAEFVGLVRAIGVEVPGL